jgi:hypothetical protein
MCNNDDDDDAAAAEMPIQFSLNILSSVACSGSTCCRINRYFILHPIDVLMEEKWV